MKTIFLSLILTSLAIAGWSQTIELTNSSLSINGSSIPANSAIRQFQSILGPHDRKANLANNIHTYDGKGLYIYEDPKSLIIINIAVQYMAQDLSFAPKANYKGKLTINGYKISKKMKAEKLTKIPSSKIDDLGWSVKLIVGSYDIYFSFDEKTGKIVTAEISLQ